MASRAVACNAVKRIATACDEHTSCKHVCGDRRACCFDRSGMSGRGNMGAPEAAEQV